MPASPGAMQGNVTVYHFPGLLGTLGWGWLHPRFLVLEHSVLLLYASEDDWAEHHEPLDDMPLSHASTIEALEEAGEVVVKVRCPNKAPLSFHGASGDVTGPKSDTWRRALTREIGVLRREVRPRPPPPPSPPPESTTASGGVDAGIGPWRLWGALSGGVAKAGIAQKVQDLNDDDDSQAAAGAAGEVSSDDAPSLNAAASSADEESSDEEGDGEQEEKRGGSSGKASSRNPGHGDGKGAEGGGGGGQRNLPTPRKSKAARLRRRWPLRRGGTTHFVPDYDPSSSIGSINTVSGRDNGNESEDDDSEHHGGPRGDEALAPLHSGVAHGPEGGRSTGAKLWKKAATAVWGEDGTNCGCKLCRESARTASQSARTRRALRRGTTAHKCTWTTRKGTREGCDTPAINRWEYLVGRWVPLQLARSGDVGATRSFLEKYPAYPDKNNLLRAAVRYKQYDLVEYFLEEQNMSVNIKNAAGMPLVWFSVVFMQKGDSGVMLRYLLQKGADIKTRSKHGQTVLSMVVSSRGKEAIAMLKYLVEECGLSLLDRDDFGCQPLHWAVLHGHLDTVQWISRTTRYIAARADWAGAFQKMEKIRLVRPEHMGAVRSWRMRGLQKSARSLTPLGVAILHNHAHIAKFLMGYGSEDPRCIAAKRNNLFNQENRDLALVAKTWPELLPEVLQGFEHRDVQPRYSWDTDEKRTKALTGWVERTYDVKLLYGAPEVPPSRSPLNILLSTGHPSLFEIKVVQMVVALKWSVFGHRYYIWELLRYFLLAISFILGFIIWGDSHNWVGAINAGENEMHVIGGTLSRSLCWALTLYNLFVEEGRELKSSKSLRKYFLSGWNLQSVVAYILILSLIPVFRPWQRQVDWEVDELEYTSAGIIRRVMTAPAALFLFTRFMEHLAVWRSTGIFIAVIRMVIVDTASWSVLFILFEAAFALAFYALLQGNPGFETIWATMVTVFVMSIGEVNIPFSEDGNLHIVGVLMFVTFMLIVAIVYLNLLVAMMTSGYAKLVNGATAQAMMNRSAALVKWEGIMSHRTREKSYKSVAPGKGKRSHITLTGWFSGGSTEVFCGEEGATAVEPEKNTFGKHLDPQALIMQELASMRETIEALTKRGLRANPGTSLSSSDDLQDLSFRKRQAGMLDKEGRGLSSLRLTDKSRRGSFGSVTASEVQEWREKARAVQESAKSRRGITRAQAVIRGYLARANSRARFLPDN